MPSLAPSPSPATGPAPGLSLGGDARHADLAAAAHALVGVPQALPRVRCAMAADLPAVAAIHAEWLRRGAAASAAFAAEPMDLRQLTALRERLVVQGYPCLVAEAGAGGAVLGFAFAAPFATRAAWRGTVEGGVCVRPDIAGRGVGRALLAGLIAACEAKGFRQMVAVIGGTAEEGGASLALHRALGFEQAGVLRGVGLHQGAPVDSVLMQRALGGEAKRGAATAPVVARTAAA